MNHQEILSHLKAGNQRFISNNMNHNLQDSIRRKELLGGQSPHTIVLSCADSRVIPELAFDAGIGELFVVRVAGNIANSSSIASIEYAVAHLGSKVLMVMGHQNCGAVTAAIHGGDNGYNLNHLLSHITPALAVSKENDEVNDVVKKHAQLTKDELVKRSDIIRNAVEKNNLQIVSAYYNLDSGVIDFL